MSFVVQPLARMGADMTGVDAVEKNIGVASVHAVKKPRILHLHM